MREEVTKAAQMLNSILNQQGYDFKKKTIIHALKDFEKSTMAEIENNFDNNIIDDIEDLLKHYNVYSDLKNLLNDNPNPTSEYQNAYDKIIGVYKYYEQKHIRELEFRDSEKRKKYIEEILVPIILISLFFEEHKTSPSSNKTSTLLRASIFQKNIVSKSNKSDFVEKFQNCLVDIDESKLIVYEKENVILETELTQYEDDFHTISFKGNFPDNEGFRVIRPKDIALENMKKKYDCISAFSVASLSPNGYAIHFILTEENDIRNLDTIEKEKRDHIQKLIDGCIMALQNELYQNFIEYSKNLLKLVVRGSDLLNYEHGEGILTVLINNNEIYTPDEQLKILT